MTVTTKRDAVDAAMSVAQDIAEGRLAPPDLEQQAVADLRALAGQVIGPDDPVWELQVEIARGVLAAGGIAADELSEWLAVERQRAGEALSQPDPDPAPPEPEPLLSVAFSPDLAEPDAEQPAEPGAEPVAAAIPPQRRPGDFDPLRGWTAAKRGFLS
jgi:hypothetical protein